MDSFNITEIMDWLKDGNTWLVLLIVAIFGMLGGLARLLVSPREDRTRLEGYLIVGAVSSIAVLFIFDPENAVKLIALSLVAGYAGKAILDALELRVKLAIANERTAEAEDKGKQAVETGKMAYQRAAELYQYSNELEKNLVILKKQPKEDILESFTGEMPEIAYKSSENVLMELENMESKLNYLERFFQK